MFGILGFLLDAIIILAILFVLLLTGICTLTGLAPQMVKWTAKLLVNPMFWVVVIGFIFLS